jgi:hypothetical protein
MDWMRAADTTVTDGLTPREREATAIRESYVASAVRVAGERVRCATCRDSIPAGARYREDSWRDPVFGRVLSSAICGACDAEGL